MNVGITHIEDEIEGLYSRFPIVICAPLFVSAHGDYPYTLIYIKDDELAARTAYALGFKHRWSHTKIIEILTQRVFVNFPIGIPLKEAGHKFSFRYPADGYYFWELLHREPGITISACRHYSAYNREFNMIQNAVNRGADILDDYDHVRIFWVLKSDYGEIYNILSGI